MARLLLWHRWRLDGYWLAGRGCRRGRIALLGRARRMVLVLVSARSAEDSTGGTHHSRERTVGHRLVLVALPFYTVHLVLMLGRVPQQLASPSACWEGVRPTGCRVSGQCACWDSPKMLVAQKMKANTFCWVTNVATALAGSHLLLSNVSTPDRRRRKAWFHVPTRP